MARCVHDKTVGLPRRLIFDHTPPYIFAAPQHQTHPFVSLFVPLSPSVCFGFLSQGDRFIPNRPSMNFDLCNHMLLNNSENEPQPGSDAPAPLRREFEQALRNTLLSSAGGGSSQSDRGGGGSGGISVRVLSVTERPPPQEDRCTNVLKVGSETSGGVWEGFGRLLCFFNTLCGGSILEGVHW